MGMTWRSLDLLRRNLGDVGEGVASYIKGRQEEAKQEEAANMIKKFIADNPAQYDMSLAPLAHSSAPTDAFAAIKAMQPKRELVTQSKTGAVHQATQPFGKDYTISEKPLIEGTDPTTQVEWIQAKDEKGQPRFGIMNGVQVPILQGHDRTTKAPIPGWEKFGSAVGTGMSAAMAGGEPIDDKTLRFFAERELAGGEPPSISARDLPTKRKYNAMLAAVAAERGITGEGAVQNRALYNAHKKAITDLTARKALVKSYEGAALNNIKVAEEMAKKYKTGPWPAMNRFQNWYAERIDNNPAFTSLENAIYTAVREYAKVATGSLGAAGLTDAGMKEAERLLNTAQSPEQFAAAVAVMKRDLANVPLAIDEEIKMERDLISSLLSNTSDYEKGKQPTAAPSTGGTVKVRRKSDGKTGTMSEESFKANADKYERVQ